MSVPPTSAPEFCNGSRLDAGAYTPKLSSEPGTVAVQSSPLSGAADVVGDSPAVVVVPSAAAVVSDDPPVVVSGAADVADVSAVVSSLPPSSSPPHAANASMLAA